MIGFGVFSAFRVCAARHSQYEDQSCCVQMGLRLGASPWCGDWCQDIAHEFPPTATVRQNIEEI